MNSGLRGRPECSLGGDDGDRGSVPRNFPRCVYEFNLQRRERDGWAGLGMGKGEGRERDGLRGRKDGEGDGRRGSRGDAAAACGRRGLVEISCAQALTPMRSRHRRC